MSRFFDFSKKDLNFDFFSNISANKNILLLPMKDIISFTVFKILSLTLSMKKSFDPQKVKYF